MKEQSSWYCFAVIGALGLATSSTALAAPDIPALEDLGKRVFFDSISSPPRQACVSCHDPESGWTSGKAGTNKGQVAVTGADPHTVGGRKPPSNAYASFSGTFGDSDIAPPGGCAAQILGVFCQGGLFWDGRATGQGITAEAVFAGDEGLTAAYAEFLGPVADQALGPFANPVEQNVPLAEDGGRPGAHAVCTHVQDARYAELFEFAWGEPIACTPDKVARSFERIAVAISAWQHSAEVNSFSSRRDLALATDADATPGAFPLQEFTAAENLGHDLFYGRVTELNPSGKDARCAACHNSGAPDSNGEEPEQLYTDQRYHHLGVPPNYEIANFVEGAPDFGLSHHTNPDAPGEGGHAGHFRTPTLRNVDQRLGRGFVKAYMHNGYFKNLEDVVHFYNTALSKRDPEACPPGTTAAQARARDCWPAPEVDNGLVASNFGLMGALGLSEFEEAALVAYLKTLSDQQVPRRPRPY